jgi:hypothetical protein
LFKALGVPMHRTVTKIDENDYSGLWIVNFPDNIEPVFWVRKQPF